MGCFFGRLMSAASDQKLFCELCSEYVLFKKHNQHSYCFHNTNCTEGSQEKILAGRDTEVVEYQVLSELFVGKRLRNISLLRLHVLFK